MKYYKCHVAHIKKTRLVFQDCNIADDCVMEIAASLLQIENFTLEELDLSNNMISDFGCKHIAAILMKTKLKKVNLSGNIMIDKDGLKEITSSIRKNAHIEQIDLKNCGIDLEGATCWQEIMEDIS